jgi:hypothetical protein
MTEASRIWYVYSLHKPRCSELVYIGRTYRPETRLKDAERRYKKKFKLSLFMATLDFVEASDYERDTIRLRKPTLNKCVRSARGNLGHTGYALNLSEAGRNAISTASKRERSKEERAKISASRMGMSYGPHTAEHNSKIGDSLRGQKRGPYTLKHRMKIRAAKLAYHARQRSQQ